VSERVVEGGSAIRLEFLDDEGKPASVEFPFDQAESIVMTVPQVLSQALQWSTHSQSPHEERFKLRCCVCHEGTSFRLWAQESRATALNPGIQEGRSLFRPRLS
jgi:hypothetical protein